MPRSSVAHSEIVQYAAGSSQEQMDLLVVEEPLEIRLGYGPADDRQQKSISLTMRTPGQDLELAAGFLFSEGILQTPDELRRIEHCLNVSKPEEVDNVVKAELEPSVEVDLEQLQRHFYTTSSCGVCGKTSIEALGEIACAVYPEEPFRVEAELIHQLSDRARHAQTVFRHTGGIHATALFNREGELQILHEDVGRHNAMDKVIGAHFLQGNLPLSESIALCSGRLGFELVQKALRAGIPILCAVGAPSSLAVELAQTYGLTLLGFVREGRFNIYAGPERLLISPDLPPSR